MENSDPTILIIEPYYGGSHKQLIDTLIKHFETISISYRLVSLPAKKWHWRARCGAIQIYDKIPKITSEKVVLCSSVLNLCELIGLRGDLNKLKKIVYFHENQLIYPVQEVKERDIQYCYNQIVTCLAADLVLFNSQFNRTTFLNNINKILKLIPDHRPKGLKEIIEIKSQVLYFPIVFPRLKTVNNKPATLHIVWPHRWEFDKNPEGFFGILFKLKNAKRPFKVSILGEMYSETPSVFNKTKLDLKDEIINFGFVDNKSDYYDILTSCHVVVSTAKHEFFGVSMLEATYCGCFPLAPDDLVYPEIYPEICLYKNLNELYEKLENFCLKPELLTDLRQSLKIDFQRFSSQCLMPKYVEVLFEK